MSTVKDEFLKLVERLPDGITWDEMMYALFVRQKIAGGEMALDEERTVTQEEVKRRLTSA